MTTPIIAIAVLSVFVDYICFYSEVREYVSTTRKLNGGNIFLVVLDISPQILFIGLVFFIYLVQFRKRVYNPVDVSLSFVF